MKLLEKNEALPRTMDAQVGSVCKSYTDAILMATATALVGFLMVYLMFFDSAPLL